MTKNELINNYFDWIYRRVCDDEVIRGKRYYKLLSYLHNIDFDYIIAMDSNRASDGINLRYRFGYECDHHAAMVTCYLDDRDCSVLEMIVALAIRCVEDVMDEANMGNQVSQWFWIMMDNLGLSEMTDNHFNEAYVSEVVDDFLYRRYGRDGTGGLFVIEDCDRDLRSVEIWCQMMWYLDSILNM